jgi:hypothetical protein
VATTRLRHLGLDVPGRIIAQIGGTVAASMLALAGAANLTATQPHVADSAAAVRALYGLSYASGGPAFVLFTGLLVAGITISALAGDALPRPLARTGVGVAALCEICSLVVAWDRLGFLLPIGRFSSLAWLIAVGLLLPANRRELRRRRGIVRAVDAG